MYIAIPFTLNRISVLNRANIIEIMASVIWFNFVLLWFWSSSGMKIMLFHLPSEESDVSMLTACCVQITSACAWGLAVSSTKNLVYLSDIFVNSVF